MTYNEKIVDLTTGKEIIRPYTADEVAAVEFVIAEKQLELSKIEAEQSKKNKARQSVLDKLGLTTEEIAALML